MYNVSLCIPIFNEDKNIPILFSNILKSGLYDCISEIIYVDDCSNDNSFSELKKIEIQYKKIKILKHKSNLGQSFSIKTAINHSTNLTIATIDGDCQNNPSDLINLIKIFFANDNLKLVGGIREKRKDNIIKVFSSKVANQVRQAILKDNCPDTGCALKVFDKSIFLKFPFFNGIHRFLPALFIGYGYETKFHFVSHTYRMHGFSKYGTFDRLFKGIIDIFRVLKIIKNFKSKM